MISMISLMILGSLISHQNHGAKLNEKIPQSVEAAMHVSNIIIE